MSTSRRAYRYVGPHHVITAVQSADGGVAIRTAADFADWATAQTAEELGEPFTFVIGTDGVLRLAPRRSEHVACASGGRVLSAGEISFSTEAGRWAVNEVSNQSTGYCPGVTSWAAVAQALDQADLDHPDYFTHAVVFRRCPTCQEHNIVREATSSASSATQTCPSDGTSIRTSETPTDPNLVNHSADCHRLGRRASGLGCPVMSSKS